MTIEKRFLLYEDVMNMATNTLIHRKEWGLYRTHVALIEAKERLLKVQEKRDMTDREHVKYVIGIEPIEWEV